MATGIIAIAINGVFTTYADAAAAITANATYKGPLFSVEKTTLPDAITVAGKFTYIRDIV